MFYFKLALVTIPLLSAHAQGLLSRDTAPTKGVTDFQWNALNASVSGRLFTGTPFAKPCFSGFKNSSFDPSISTCSDVQSGYSSTTVRSNNFGAYQNSLTSRQTQWETCQRTNQKCLLDAANPSDPLAFEPPQVCHQGSISKYYIDVRTAQDVSVAFKFSQETRVPLAIKNTGHDYEGRSSLANSLGLWTHNLKGNISYDPFFVPEGCPRSRLTPGVTYQAGEQWIALYEFAEGHNITLVGGASKTVGAAGAWLQGGGHGPLTNTMGLGIDRVLQFKVVTPDGELRVANSCQNTDLFFALRGGGAATFGVVVETTTTASPKTAIQVASVSFETNERNNAEFMSLVVSNIPKWVREGWGAYIQSSSALFMNPVLSHYQAQASIKPLLDFVESLAGNKTNVFVEEPSFLSFHTDFIDLIDGPAGQSLAIGSRFIPVDNFSTKLKQEELITAISRMSKEVDFFEILATTPFSAPPSNGTSSTLAWRNSLLHITSANVWNFNATAIDIKARYKGMTRAMDHIRKITPGSGTYINEADVYEPDYKRSFWGDNYQKLLDIKNKYDPLGLLNCWHCVGWTGANDPRFSCYL